VSGSEPPLLALARPPTLIQAELVLL